MNNKSNQSSHDSGHDQVFTEKVIAAMGDKTNPRMRLVLSSLVKHLHFFAREVDLTTEEWLAGIDFMNRCGKMQGPDRDEFALISDILGFESLVESLGTQRHIIRANPENHKLKPTSSCILGPFYRSDAALLPRAGSVVSPETREKYLDSTVHMSGQVFSTSGAPIEGAIVDVWHTAPNGMYEQQDPQQPDMDLRGRFSTDQAGNFELYCLRPVAYPLPAGGPTEELLKLMDRHPWRPAHLHFIVSAPGYRSLVTQLFDSEDKWLQNDTVFAVKRDLIVDYSPLRNDNKARWSLGYNFILLKEDGAGSL